MFLDGVNNLAQLGAFAAQEQDGNLDQQLGNSAGTLLGEGQQVDDIAFGSGALNGGWSLNIPLYENVVNTAWDYKFTTEFGEQVVRRDPVIIDWDGNGEVSTKGKDNSAERISFDVNADGLMDRTEWVKGDALLVYDANGDGTINDGRELMNEVGINGEQGKYASGWDKAKDVFDTNKDGKIQDKELDKVKIWVDANADGKTDEGELKSAKDAHIEYIDTDGSYVMRKQQTGVIDYSSMETINYDVDPLTGSPVSSMTATTSGFGNVLTNIFDPFSIFGDEEEEDSALTAVKKTANDANAEVPPELSLFF